MPPADMRGPPGARIGEDGPMRPDPHPTAPASTPGPAVVGKDDSPAPAPPAPGRHEVTLRFLAAPTDQGHSGTVDAGRVLEWVDKAALPTTRTRPHSLI